MNTLETYRTILRFLLLLLGVVALSGQHAHAQDCKLSISQTELDFGQIRHPGATSKLDGQHLYTLGTRYVALNASCPANSKLMLILRGDSLAKHFRFAAQGQLQVRLSNALLDGRAVDLAVVRAVGEAPGAPASAIDVTPGDLIVPVSGGLAAEGSLLSLQIEVSPGVAMDEFSARDRKTLEGHFNFEVREY